MYSLMLTSRSVLLGVSDGAHSHSHEYFFRAVVVLLIHIPTVVVDRVLGPVLAQGSTATGSLTHRVKPERLARQNRSDN